MLPDSRPWSPSCSRDGDRGDEEQDHDAEAQVVAGRRQTVESGRLQAGEGSQRNLAMEKIWLALPYLQMLPWANQPSLDLVLPALLQTDMDV